MEDRDLGKGHPLLRERLPAFLAEFARRGIELMIGEIARSDQRQGWLWCQGRPLVDVVARGFPKEWARRGGIVTNAWSAKLSAHGFTINGVPAACGTDLIPVGADRKPWTADDRWSDFVALSDDMNDVGGQLGLIHFHAPGKAVWDRPHVQCIEWSDAKHGMVIGGVLQARS